MQGRSRSAQERKAQPIRSELQAKLEWILNEKCTSDELKTRQREVGKQSKPARLHPFIQKVESVENVQLVSMKSAIHELQALAIPTSRAQHQPDGQRNHPKIQAKTESIIYQSPRHYPDRKQPLHRNKMDAQQNQTVQYYKDQNSKLKAQLAEQRSKNQECAAIIKKLEHSNVQLQKEVTLLLQKWQGEHANAERINMLQQDFKQQLIINLELEEVLLKQKLQIEKKHTQKVPDGHIKNVIKELKNQLAEQKQNSEKEIQALQAAIQGKDKEITELKEIISKLNENKYQEGLTSLHMLQSPSPKVPGNFMERFVSFSKEMETKLAQQNIVSTNPSLRDTAMIELEANRRKSDSEYSKGNCPSLSIPMLQVKVVQSRPVSKTDRT